MPSPNRVRHGRRLILAVLAAGLALVPAAHATAPGANGQILTQRGSDCPCLESHYLELLDPATGAATPLGIPFARPTTDPSLAPDGRRFAYVEHVESAGDLLGDIFVSDGPNGPVRNVTRSGSANERQPAWSADGSLVAYTSGPYDSPAVWTMRPDGSGKRRVVAGAYDPAWSPDGKRLAFARSGEIYTIGRTGSDPKRLTYDRDTDGDPTWSPDGRRIAWSSDQSFAVDSAEIWSGPATGGVPTRLTRNTTSDLEPDWSPDGTRIAVMREGRADETFHYPQVWTIAATGGDEQLVGRWHSAPDWQRLP